MDPHLKIKVNIADRVYPLTIKREEEEMIRRAVKMINETVRSFQEKYAVKDKQDVLAMCALQWASQLEKLKVHDKMEMNEVNKALEEFDDIISNPPDKDKNKKNFQYFERLTIPEAMEAIETREKFKDYKNLEDADKAKLIRLYFRNNGDKKFKLHSLTTAYKRKAQKSLKDE